MITHEAPAPQHTLNQRLVNKSSRINQLDASFITPSIPPHSSTILLQTPTTTIATHITANVIRTAGSSSSRDAPTIPTLALDLTHDVVTQVALVERCRRVGCTAHALQLGTLRAGGCAFAGEALAAADGFPGRFGGAGRPVPVGLYGVALAGSGVSFGQIGVESSWCRGRETRMEGLSSAKARLTCCRRNYCDADSRESGLD